MDPRKICMFVFCQFACDIDELVFMEPAKRKRVSLVWKHFEQISTNKSWIQPRPQRPWLRPNINKRKRRPKLRSRKFLQQGSWWAILEAAQLSKKQTVV
ncbi:uncharacterized protein LOC118240896 isoform X4 [Electrophorus electricus]|uniref:uncharacterized protein LOC118240896 isoform X4 n=1 Tax=Electrophorus electricus TaxID=8005 RepID=UPI0015D0971E|nr:uncharacterized protein LOC118240896 isoform X4 [Electrophorus electricus]